MPDGLLVALKLKHECKRACLIVHILHKHPGTGIQGLTEHVGAERLRDQRNLKGPAIPAVGGGHEIRHIVGIKRAGIALRVHSEVYRARDGYRGSKRYRPVLSNGEKRIVRIFQAILDLVRSIARHIHTSIS